MATAYSTRPSAILGLPPESWVAYDLDRALLALAGRVERAADEARAKAHRGRASAEQVGRRVEAAVRAILTTAAERRAEAERIAAMRRRRVEFVWAEGLPRGPESLLGVRTVPRDEED